MGILSDVKRVYIYIYICVCVCVRSSQSSWSSQSVSEFMEYIDISLSPSSLFIHTYC